MKFSDVKYCLLLEWDCLMLVDKEGEWCLWSVLVKGEGGKKLWLYCCLNG